LEAQKEFSLRKELLRKRTILSFVLSLILLTLFLSYATIGDITRLLREVKVLFLILAFVSHYLSYILRGYRWRRMIERTEFTGGAFDLAKIIFIFQSVGCVLPAKLGDVYGAHLMKINFSLSRSFSLGSIFLWRLFDFGVVMAFAIGSALILFGSKVPSELIAAMKIIVPCVLGLLILIGLLFHSHKWFFTRFASERLERLINSFREGLRLEGKMLPSLMMATTFIWLLEAGRFFFVCRSMGVNIHWAQVIFVTCSTLLLTAIPLTPAGLGAVELGMLKLLAFVGIGNPVAYPLIILDRFIAHWSQIILGIVLVSFSRAMNVKMWQFEEDKVLPPTQNLAVSSKNDTL